MHKRGLRNSRGGRLTLNGLTKIFQNQFYIGVIYVKTTGRTYKGVHEPLVSVATWQQVQAIREDRCGPKVTRHSHLFQGLFHCADCGNPMVPELQKGRVYYRCKRRDCATKTIREDALEHAIRCELASLELSARANAVAEDDIDDGATEIAEQRTSLTLQIKDDERRLDRLQDLLLDEAISLNAYNQKQDQLNMRLAGLKEQLQKLPNQEALAAHRAKLAELRKSLVFLYDSANRVEKRCIVESVWPNRTVSGKEPALEPDSWVVRKDIGDFITEGAQERDKDRTTHDIALDDTSPMQPILVLLEQKMLRD